MSRPTKPEQVLMQFKVPRDLHKALRLYALQQDETMSEAGTALIERCLREVGWYPTKHASAEQSVAQEPAKQSA